MKKVVILLALSSVLVFAQQKLFFTDSRDGKTYRAVKIGKQIWMAENLNYAANGSKCYENYEINCQIYGRLYNWNTARKSCPKGWHLPSNAEWKVLMKEVNPSCSNDRISCVGAGTKLKARAWYTYNGDREIANTDEYGFAALPGGGGNSSGDFGGSGFYGSWWNASEIHANYAYNWGMDMFGESVDSHTDDKSYLMSVRCVMD